MRSSHTRLATTIIAGLFVATACTSAATPAPATTPTALPSIAVTPMPPQTPAVTPATTQLPTAPPPSPTDSFAITVAVTVVDSLRVRSQPRVSGDSNMYEPLLPLGTQLLIFGGPVSASGYAWYEVVPLTSRTLPSGWIASAGRDREPWIAADAFDCPPVPTDFRSLAALPRGVGLACFPHLPITVQARLISCNCDADGAWYTPGWFSFGGGISKLLVEPDVTSAPPDWADWFLLNLDPAGEHPDPLPLGKLVEVTGIFDHPAATTCTLTEMDGEPVHSHGCRLEFAVTRLVVQGL